MATNLAQSVAARIAEIGTAKAKCKNAERAYHLTLWAKSDAITLDFYGDGGLEGAGAGRPGADDAAKRWREAFEAKGIHRNEVRFISIACLIASRRSLIDADGNRYLPTANNSEATDDNVAKWISALLVRVRQANTEELALVFASDRDPVEILKNAKNARGTSGRGPGEPAKIESEESGLPSAEVIETVEDNPRQAFQTASRAMFDACTAMLIALDIESGEVTKAELTALESRMALVLASLKSA